MRRSYIVLSEGFRALKNGPQNMVLAGKFSEVKAWHPFQYAVPSVVRI